jgi:serine/threonine protein kinase
MLANMREEIRILNTLDHPNIIKYFEQLETEDYIYIVMEHCDGGTLYDKILKSVENRKLMSETEVA